MSSTISELAAKLNLSKGTVSQILNHKGEAFSPETRRRVFAAARETGYRPHPIARALATGRTGFVGVWVNDLGSAYHAHVAHTMEHRLKGNGYDVFITLQAGQNPIRRAVLPPIVADGIIAHEIYGPAWDELHRNLNGRIPIINTGVWVQENSLDYVAIDLSPATLAAIRHLVASGRRRIAYLVNVLPPALGISSRYDDYHRVMQESGLVDEFIITGSSDRDRVRASARTYFQEKGCPEAIFCHCDDAAIAAYRAACDLGIRIPDDLALVGCDGIQDTEYFPCPITTIVQPLDALCEMAARFMERRLTEPDAPPQQTTLTAELVIRESSR